MSESPPLTFSFHQNTSASLQTNAVLPSESIVPILRYESFTLILYKGLSGPIFQILQIFFKFWILLVCFNTIFNLDIFTSTNYIKHALFHSGFSCKEQLSFKILTKLRIICDNRVVANIVQKSKTALVDYWKYPVQRQPSPYATGAPNQEPVDILPVSTSHHAPVFIFITDIQLILPVLTLAYPAFSTFYP